MLRLGLTLGSTSVRAGLLAQPRLPQSTVLSVVPALYTPCRTMAAKPKADASKKQRYSTKETVKHKRVLSGLRHRRVTWLDSPWPKTISRKKKPLRQRLYSLNTNKRLAHYIKDLKHRQKENPAKRPHEPWLRTLADQGRISTENAAALTDYVLKECAIKPENLRSRTYEVLLEMWHKRKNLERATEVFEVMRANGKLTDYGYSVYCKTLATRGHLDQAKELMLERIANESVRGYETLRAMVNYVAADNLEEGVKLFEKWCEVRSHAKSLLKAAGDYRKQQERKAKKANLADTAEPLKESAGETLKESAPKESSGETPKPPKKAVVQPSKEELKWAQKVLQYDDEMYSMIIGWCLKHGEIDRAESYYEFRLRQKKGRCPVYTDQTFSAKITAHEEAMKKRNAAFAQYEDEVRRLKEDPNPKAYDRAISGGLLRKPNVPVPPYPKRYTVDEYLKAFPVVFTSHILRPLIDLEASGKELDPTWVRRIGDGLRNDDVRNGIIMVAQKIHVNDKKRYTVLQNLLKKMDLPVEELTKIRPPKVEHTAPVKTKKVQEIKKWWLVGGRVKQEQ